MTASAMPEITDSRNIELTPEDLARLCEADAAGVFAAPGESPAEFESRRQCYAEAEAELLRQEGAPLGVRISEADRIPMEELSEAGSITGNIYGFTLGAVPAFYADKRILGFLCGGCLFGDPDSGMSLLLLRREFQKRDKWLFYRKYELLAHESCHAARLVLNEPVLEEHFAYQWSPSWLRRHIGAWFSGEWDGWFLLLPALLLLAGQILQTFYLPQLPVWPFWLLVAAVPAGYEIRNVRQCRLLSAAAAGIAAAVPRGNIPAILFRCTMAELKKFGELSAAPPEKVKAYYDELCRRELRFMVIRERFSGKEEEND